MTDEVQQLEATETVNTPAPQEASPDAGQELENKPEVKADPNADEKGTTARDSVKRALAAATATDEPEPKPEAKPEPKADPKAEAKPEPKAEPDAKPKADAKPENDVEVPSRFSPDAKEAWKNAPAPVKSEITRALGELESGLEKYRAQWEPLKGFAEMAERSGTTIDKALDTYVGFDRQLQANPAEGLAAIAKAYGVDFAALAAQVAGQKPPERDASIEALKTTIEGLQGELQSFKTQSQASQQQTAQDAAMREVEAFAASNPRFSDLESEIASILEVKTNFTLQQAYELADRINPAPQPAKGDAEKPAPDAEKPKVAQTNEKANLSIEGGGGGSSPKAEPSKTARDAVKNALRTL